jgi:prepilin-type N-terminal cleavage/methylation domain-containing protein
MNKKGFTLIEILIYTAILAMVAGLFTGILAVATRFQVREAAANEVGQQLNFVTQTIQRLVRQSSNVEVAAQTNNPDTTDPAITEISYLQLRMENPANDPTCISLLNDGAIYITLGPRAGSQNKCKDPVVTDKITTDKVIASIINPVGLVFTKASNPPGHDIVQIDLTLNSNTTNPQSAVTRKISTAIGRVSAATFDSDLVPGIGTSNVGQVSSPWQDGYFSGNLTVNGSVVAAGTSGYLQFKNSGAGAPVSGCAADADRGRLYIDTTNNRLYVCNGLARAWDYITLTN